MIPEWLLYLLSFGGVGVFAYALLRFGPVSHSYLRFTGPELARLKQMEASNAGIHAAARRRGTALYKRRLASHEGLAVYPNGLYAKFCRGRKGHYRFVPFEALTGIYPVTYENPIRSARATRLGLTGWKGLQFETAQGWVFVADSHRHAFEQLVPSLKRALGPGWDRLYRPDEPLWSDILTGDAMVHRAIREMRGRTTPREERPRVDAPADETGIRGDRGALLFEERPSDMKVRFRVYRKAGLLMIGCGAGLLLLGALAAELLRLAVYVWGLFFIPACAFLALAFLFFTGSRNGKPIRVYEHGIEFPTIGGVNSQFVSFADLVDVEERRNVLDGDYYRLSRLDLPPISIHRSPGFTAILPEIRGRIGRVEHRVSQVEESYDPGRFRRWEAGLYAFGPLAGLIGSLVIVLPNAGGASGSVLLWEFLLVFPPLATLLTAVIPLLLQRSWKLKRERLRVWIPASIVAVLLAASFIILAVALSQPTYTMPSPAMQPRPTTTALVAGTYADAILDVHGPVRVDAGETLILRNVTVRMNLTADRAFGLWVAPGGTLVVENSTIENATAPFAYPFEVAGSARIENTTIAGLWGNWSQVNGDGGLELYSDDVRVENTTILAPRTNGILVIDAAPKIANVTIRNAGDDGIELRHSDARLQNDTVSGSAWALTVEAGSSAQIRGSLIEGNEHGVAIQSSDPVLSSNRFQDNRNYAVWYDEHSQPILEANVFVANDKDVVAEPASSSLEVCGFSTLGLGILSLLMIAAVYREELRRASEHAVRPTR